MRIICVDDEVLILELVVRLCGQLPQISDVKGFLSADEALGYLKDNEADIALLDIEMPKMNDSWASLREAFIEKVANR